MNLRDLIEMECTSCNNVIYADKNADYWYCGICGKRIDIKASAELQEKENKLKAKEAELKIRENALKKKEAELKEKEELIKAIENGEELLKQETPASPTFKASPVADGVVPKLNRPDTVLNNPEMKFTNLASADNKPSEPVQPAKTEPATAKAPVAQAPAVEKQSTKTVAPAPAKKAETPVKNPDSFQMEGLPEKKEEPKKEQAITSKTPESLKKPSDGKPKEFEMNEHTLVKYNAMHAKVSKVYLPGNVWRIGSGAFKANKNITSVVCGDNIKEIGDSAFMDCTELTEIILSGELRKINYKTFNGCTNLKSINIPESVTEIMCDSMVCGLEEITLNNPRTTWEQASDFADASFSVDKNGNGKGVSRIIFKGVEYKAVDVFKHGCLANYFKANGLCQYCGNKFSFVNGKCPTCKSKKDY